MKVTTTKAFGLMIALALISCANMDRRTATKGDHLTLATYSPITTQAAANDTLDKWEDRLASLKKSSSGAATKDRHSDIEKRIAKIEDELEDGREHYHDLRTAKAEDKQKYIDKLNGVFKEVTSQFNAALAE